MSFVTKQKLCELFIDIATEMMFKCCLPIKIWYFNKALLTIKRLKDISSNCDRDLKKKANTRNSGSIA